MDQYILLINASYYYSVFLITNNVIGTIIYSIVGFFIFWKTPKKVCLRVKYGLLFCATMGYLVATAMTFFQPVPLFPYSCVF